MRVEGCRVRAEELDVLLRHGARFVDGLGALACAFCELFSFVLDFGMQALKDGEHGALELLCGFEVLVGNAL